MSDYISFLIKDYQGTEYKDFVAYVYGTLTKKSHGCKGKSKDKYIKIRDDVLRYITSNKNVISLELKK
tara:strand:+ start:956 stop:1159 length:204 start_codon:yes stop_codon:yes gene_type:complete